MKSINSYRRKHWIHRDGVLISIVTFALTAVAYATPPANLFVTGGQYSRSSQGAYFGAILPFSGATLGNGFFVSPFADWNRYTFFNNGRTFTGTEPSASLAIGHAWNERVLSFSLSLAGGYSNTSVSPYAPQGSFHGGQWFAEPEIYAQAALPAGLSATVDAGYLTGLRSYWSSAYLLMPITSSMAVGPEVDVGGGINYRARTYALRFSDDVSKVVAVDFSAGVMTDLPAPYRPYLAVNLSVPVP